jgi:hypothetical protein
MDVKVSKTAVDVAAFAGEAAKGGGCRMLHLLVRLLQLNYKLIYLR